MPKVSVKLGITFQASDKKFSPWFRADVEFMDIDLDQDVDEQTRRCLEAADSIAVAAEGALTQEAANVSGVGIEGAGLASEFATFRTKFSGAWKKLVERVDALAGEAKPKKTKKGKK